MTDSYCDQCNGLGFTGSDEENNKEVCDLCGGYP